MGKKQMESTAIVPTEPTRGRPFRVNSADLAQRVAALEAALAEARANIQAISLIVDKISRG